MVKSVRNVAVGMFTGVVSQKQKFSTTVNCYKGKEDSLESTKYKELKLADQILKIVERVMEKLMRRQVNTDKIQFDLMS